MQNYDVIILGAGAAGLMCAMRAGQRGKKVLVLDHADRAGSKILVSGGGRCNFTNLNIAADRYLSNNPPFCLSALKSFTQRDFVALVEKHRIKYHEKALGQLFCDVSSKDIVNMLLSECQAARVDIFFDQHIEDVSKADVYTVKTQKETHESPVLVLATGGLCFPKMGATNFTHQMAQRFGLSLTETRPGLVPLTFEGPALDLMKALSGIALEVIASVGKRSFRENMIFTHRGLSGPAILQISSYWREGDAIKLDLLPDTNVENFLIERKSSRPKAELKTILGEVLPHRLAQAITDTFFPSTPVGDMPHKKLREIATFLKGWTLTPSGTEGFDKAEVTLGGVDTRALSSKTMQATSVQGLYIVGEAIDVAGWLGGYNLQWAWSSGWAAGSAV